ncbi:hypothetical protein JXA84_03340 [candidate division WOR-3 bacterium]|nr:hypothetical protein [candidate division WOR-3 bacterium]
MSKAKRVFILFSAFLAPATALYCGWTRTFGGGGAESGFSVIQCSDGNFIAAGKTENDGYLIKVNSSGNLIWSKAYDENNRNDNFQQVIQSSDGGYMMIGISVFSSNVSDFWVVKTNGSGDVVWDKLYWSTGMENSGYSIVQCTDGNYVITGWSEIATQNVDLYIVKINNNGDTIFSNRFGDQENNTAFDLKQTSDGGYITCGYDENYGDYEMWLVKFDASLCISWDKEIELGSNSDIANSVLQTSDGGYIVAGYYLNSDFDAVLLKTNSSGDMTWGYAYGNYQDDFFEEVQKTSDGGYIIAGHTASYGNGGKDVWLFKVNSSGSTVFSKTFGGSADDLGYSVKQLSDGGFIVVGYTKSFGYGVEDLYLIRTNSDGVAVEENVITQDPPDNPFISVNAADGNNISIYFELPREDDVRINIYDVSGRLVSTPVSGRYLQGYHRITHQFEKGGVYIYTFETSIFSEHGKILVY